MAFELKRAKRKVQRARIAISGPSGSGKTFSALRLARGLVLAEAPERVKEDVPDDQIGIVVLDTEQRSSELYDHIAPFAAYHLEKPYTTERYAAALDEIERAKPLVVVVDQISHAWAGSGGLLEQVDKAQATAKNGNQFAAWGSITPKHTKFLERLLECRCHLIVTMRSKTEYVLEEKNGKKVPKKVGMAPVQRDGIEYEFMTTFELDRDSKEATVGKTRTTVFPEGESMLLDEAWGQKLYAWLVSAPEPEMPAGSPPWDEKAQEPKQTSRPSGRSKTADVLLDKIVAQFVAAGLTGNAPEVQKEKLAILEKCFHTPVWREIGDLTIEQLKEGLRELEQVFTQRAYPGDEESGEDFVNGTDSEVRADAEK